MTREEAIEVLTDMRRIRSDKITEACDMAISALSEHKDCTDFLCWLLEEIMDEENWEINAEADGEIIARKLKKLGLLDSKDGYYVRTPMYEALTTEPSDLISRADAIEAVENNSYGMGSRASVKAIKALPSVEQVTSKLKNPCDSLLTEDSEDSKEQKSKLDHDREWIIGCIKHDGFIKTDRFDTANQIILDALEPTEPSDLISRAELIEAIEDTDWYSPNRNGKLTQGAKDESEAWYKYEDIYKAINNLPSCHNCIECESVSAERVGEWIPKEDYGGFDYYQCSNCKEDFYFEIEPSKSEYHYCPNCGARMENTK